MRNKTKGYQYIVAVVAVVVLGAFYLLSADNKQDTPGQGILWDQYRLQFVLPANWVTVSGTCMYTNKRKERVGCSYVGSGGSITPYGLLASLEKDGWRNALPDKANLPMGRVEQVFKVERNEFELDVTYLNNPYSQSVVVLSLARKNEVRNH
jgi:hypothetical protein